jgi:hypothetical protein
MICAETESDQYQSDHGRPLEKGMSDWVRHEVKHSQLLGVVEMKQSQRMKKKMWTVIVDTKL